VPYHMRWPSHGIEILGVDVVWCGIATCVRYDDKNERMVWRGRYMVEGGLIRYDT